MAMCRQTVQRYGGFPISAIVVRDVGEALSGGYTRQPSRLHGLCKHKKRHFGAAREENLFLSRGKYIFLGRKKITPPVEAFSVILVTRLHGGMCSPPGRGWAALTLTRLPAEWICSYPSLPIPNLPGSLSCACALWSPPESFVTLKNANLLVFLPYLS